MQGDTVCDSTRPPERLDEQAITLKTPLQGVNECNGDFSPTTFRGTLNSTAFIDLATLPP
jgi:hypothetical protein